MKIYVIGDSISVHYGPYLQRYLEGFMEYSRKTGKEEALKNLDIPQGANGGDSDRVLEFLQSMEKEGIDADMLLVNCGLHDIKKDPKTGEMQVSIEKYEKNLKEILKIVSRMKPSLVWILTTPCDEHIHNKEGMEFHRYSADCQAYNKAAETIMTEAGRPIIDLYTFTCNIGENLFCDHVHFKESIREKQAAFIAGWLTNE